jgi:hypothetical protein
MSAAHPRPDREEAPGQAFGETHWALVFGRRRRAPKRNPGSRPPFGGRFPGRLPSAVIGAPAFPPAKTLLCEGQRMADIYPPD